MSGHTPGPWTFVHEEPYEMSIEKDGKRVPGLDLWLDDACFDTNGERIANGRLAAQAPILADALEAALAWEEATRSRLGLPQVDAPEWAQAGRAVLRAAGRLP